LDNQSPGKSRHATGRRQNRHWTLRRMIRRI
jgi:hypothetical protein